MSSDDIETNGLILKGNIYHCKILYRYHNIFALESRTSASFPQSQTLIVAISHDYIGLVFFQGLFSVKYMGIYRVKLMAQHTAQKLKMLMVIKLTMEILITQQIKKFMLIQKQRWAGLL